ncbi:FecR family protein [Hippea maritima]|uniref:FecR protein domain-containing protein n=1 Tax=Hippea maritima (strain ATCC 700847 / DSM 10411 / MH2) TaxID=760142 RepID=F2LX33_HIPMA|nr:FecR family protein [Hippea maritima]AEA33091.1 hypothetical protein Hipma_0111 [Hippea maritima DSM 10411]
MRRNVFLIVVVFWSLFLNSAFSAKREFELSYSPNWLYKLTAKALLSIDKDGKVRLNVVDVCPALPQAYIWIKFYSKIEDVYWYNKCVCVDFKIKFKGKGRAAEIPLDSMNDPSTYKWKGPQKGFYEDEWSETSVKGEPCFCIKEFPELAGIKQFQIVDSNPNTFSFQTGNNPKPEDVGAYQESSYITALRGEVYIYRAKTHKWVKAKNRSKLYIGDIVKTSSGVVRILLKGRVALRVKPHTMFEIPKVKQNTKKGISFIKMTYGVLMAAAEKERRSRFEVYVPLYITGVRGTKFEVSYDAEKRFGCVRVFEHSVWISDRKKRKTVIVKEGMKSCVYGNGDGLPTKPEPMKPFNVEGKWKTNFGIVGFKQKGDKVFGSYPHDNGKIEGKLIGNVLVCKWSESPTYKPYRDAGDCRFLFSPDGNSFSGHWRYGFGGESWNGDWSGERMH